MARERAAKEAERAESAGVDVVRDMASDRIECWSRSVRTEW